MENSNYSFPSGAIKATYTDPALFRRWYPRRVSGIAEVATAEPGRIVLRDAARGTYFRLDEKGLFVSLLGFLPGLTLSTALYKVSESAISMSMGMNLDRILLILALTLAMCLIAGAIALHKLKAADPADLF